MVLRHFVKEAVVARAAPFWPRLPLATLVFLARNPQFIKRRFVEAVVAGAAPFWPRLPLATLVFLAGNPQFIKRHFVKAVFARAAPFWPRPPLDQACLTGAAVSGKPHTGPWWLPRDTTSPHFDISPRGSRVGRRGWPVLELVQRPLISPKRSYEFWEVSAPSRKWDIGCELIECELPSQTSCGLSRPGFL